MWPGFGENIRAIKWIIDRCEGRVEARETPIGLVPHTKDIDTNGLEIPREKLEKLFDVNMSEWHDEIGGIKEFMDKFGSHMPKELFEEYEKLAKAIDR